MPSARVFGPWPEHSNPAASCLQWSCALQAEAVDTFFFFACAHLTRGRCCTSNLIAPSEKDGLLSTGLALAGYVTVDAAGARHRGKNGYVAHIGIEYFAWLCVQRRLACSAGDRPAGER